jgi:hypothetical protein
MRDIWGNPWWLEDSWKEQFNITSDRYLSSFMLLEQEFDSCWVKSVDAESDIHPLIKELIHGKSTSQIRHLLSISENIQTLRNVPGFERVLKAYKQTKTAYSAELEMFLARVLKSCNYEVEFIVPKPKKGKTPDILAKSVVGEFVVECKFLNNDAGEKWIENYALLFGINVNALVPNNYSLIYQPNNPQIDIWEYGYPKRLTPYQLAVAIDISAIRESANKIIGPVYGPALRRIPGKGDLIILPKSDFDRGVVYLPELNTKFFLKRLFRNGLLKASDQIRGFGLPGIAAVFYSGISELKVINRYFNELIEQDKLRHELLMGVLVFPMQNILHYNRPTWLENKYSKYSAKSFGIPSFIEKNFNPITFK